MALLFSKLTDNGPQTTDNRQRTTDNGQHLRPLMKHRDGILDLVRGLSALLVMLGHLRGFIFVDYGALAHPGLLQKALYFATGLGHQAVMVFFVLSGYFVGGSVLAGLHKGSFNWRGYAAARLSRLWMVLVPALVLTLGLDWLGGRWNPAAYAGGLNASFMSGPSVAQPAAHDVLTLVGNLGFVQTVCVPVFGSNGPLWSLANEFWYYLLFPLVAVALLGPAGRWSVVGGRWSVVGGRWSVVGGRWSVVGGRWCAAWCKLGLRLRLAGGCRRGW